MKRLALLAAYLALPALGSAQEPAPRGPADVMQRARDSAEQRQRARTSPHAGGRPPPIATSEAASDVPPGTIEVRVLDSRGLPVADQPVRVGILAQDESRDERGGTTDRNGVAVVANLRAGSNQAYRVTVPYRGANYGSMPFRLEVGRGHRVTIRRLEVTHDDGSLLQYVGQTLVEYRNERVHVSQQAQLVNLGRDTYVFPGNGLQWRLPDGFTAFQSQRVMSDQRVVATDDGLAIRGSLPPGRTTLSWAYDLPLSGEQVIISQPLPVKTFRYRVITQASDGMTMSVDGFPDADEHEVNGQRVLLAELQRSPRDPELDRLHIRIRGIPSVGPIRWIALGMAMLLAFFGILLVARGGNLSGALVEARARRKEELLDEAAEIERLFGESEVGPKYRARRLREIVDELASLLRLDAASDAASGGSVSRSGGSLDAAWAPVARGFRLYVISGAASIAVSMSQFAVDPETVLWLGLIPAALASFGYLQVARAPASSKASLPARIAAGAMIFGFALQAYVVFSGALSFGETETGEVLAAAASLGAIAFAMLAVALVGVAATLVTVYAISGDLELPDLGRNVKSVAISLAVVAALPFGLFFLPLAPQLVLLAIWALGALVTVLTYYMLVLRTARAIGDRLPE